ncbi:DUF488 domain-containing protein [Streptomyces sp. NPDC003697]
MTSAAPRLLTIGYEGRSVDELITKVRAASVTVLVDVRLTPLSRKPGLSKRRLAAALDEAGIAYAHLSALGNPQDNRAPLRDGDPRGRERFRARLRSEAAASALEQVAALLRTERVALLCFEREHTRCHRDLVAEALVRRAPAAGVEHL